ncbi:MAG: hypothetical protein HC788_01845 [Sphingopyxis sp.]|nr:hypothetical protein [Sphingopyxis sp.]
MSAIADQQHRKIGDRRLFWLWTILITAAFAVMFYQSINYTGLVHRFAEWQFARFDRYFPVLSVIGILLILYLIWELARYILRRGWRKEAELSLTMRRMSSRQSGARFLYLAAIFGAVLFVATLLQWMQQPSSDGPRREVVLAAGRPTELMAGPVSVSGLRAIGPIARYSEDFLFIRRTRFLAPIGRGSGPDAPFDLFVEVDGMDPNRDVPVKIDGILRNDALMPEIRFLYLGVNIPVAENGAVIFASPGSANRPFAVLLVEIFIFSMILWLFGRHLRRSADKLERELGV